MMDENRAAFRVWQSNFRNRQKRKHYHSVRSNIQNRVRKLKNDWWVRKSEELQRLVDVHNSREFFASTQTVWTIL